MTKQKIVMYSTLCSVFFILELLAPAHSCAINLDAIEIKPKGSVKMAYDDNVAFTSDNEKDDFVTSLSAGLDVSHEGKTHTFRLQGDITQQIYADNTSFNNLIEDILVTFEKELTKYDRFSLSNRFHHAEEPSSFEDDFGRASGRYSYVRNIFDTTYTRDLSKKLSVQGHYGNENYRTSRDDIGDSVLHRVGFDVNYFTSSATAFLFGYDFSTRTADPGGTARLHTLVTGCRHFFTKQLSAYARIGASLIEAFDGSTSTEPSVTVAVVNDFSETDSASISYTKASTASSFTADIFDSWRVAIRFTRQLLERLNASVSVFFGEGDFESLSISDTQTGVSAQLNYGVKENVQAFLGYTHSEVDSNIVSRSYDRNLVEWGIRIAF